MYILTEKAYQDFRVDGTAQKSVGILSSLELGKAMTLMLHDLNNQFQIPNRFLVGLERLDYLRYQE